MVVSDIGLVPPSELHSMEYVTLPLGAAGGSQENDTVSGMTVVVSKFSGGPSGTIDTQDKGWYRNSYSNNSTKICTACLSPHLTTTSIPNILPSVPVTFKATGYIICDLHVHSVKP